MHFDAAFRTKFSINKSFQRREQKLFTKICVICNRYGSNLFYARRSCIKSWSSPLCTYRIGTLLKKIRFFYFCLDIAWGSDPNTDPNGILNQCDLMARIRKKSFQIHNSTQEPGELTWQARMNSLSLVLSIQLSLNKSIFRKEIKSGSKLDSLRCV